MKTGAQKIELKRAKLRELKRSVRWTRRMAVVLLLLEITVASAFLMHKNWDQYKVPSETVLIDE